MNILLQVYYHHMPYVDDHYFVRLQMRIPTEHFGNIPVLMLTPQAFSPRDEEEEQPASLPRLFLNKLQVRV